MTTYSFPSLVSPASVDWRLVSNTQSFTSPLDRTTQTLELPGARWEASVTWPTLAAADWRILTAFLAKLRGAAGRFYYGPPHATATQQTITGSVLVNGASQTGGSLIVDGFTGTFKAGDFISFDTSVGRELHMVVADLTNPGTLTIEPPIRVSPADNAAVTISSPTCVMRLTDDAQAALSIRPPVTGSVAFDMVEVF